VPAAPADGPWEIAFGPRPGATVRVPSDAGAADRWAAAVALGGQGRYAAAATLLDGLRGDPAVAPVVAAHAAVTLASHRRQLGGHAAARRLDAEALARAAAGPPSVVVPGGLLTAAAAHVDALVGLAADALGTGDLAGARRLLDRADAELSRRRCREDAAAWRLPVRLGWVAAELALAGGDPAAAVRAAADADRRASGGRSSRHRVKSAIVAGVSRASWEPSTAPAALVELDALAAEATRLGLLPLHWPAALAAADLADRPGVVQAAYGAPEGGPEGPRIWADAQGPASHGRVASHPPDGGEHPSTRRSTGSPDATRTALPSDPPRQPPVDRDAARNANDRHRNRSSDAPNGTVSDAARRRHAAARTLSVLYSRSDPTGRRLMGESAWIPGWHAVT